MSKIGEMKCKEIDCILCPFNNMPIGFCLDFNSDLTLNEGFKQNKRYLSEQRIKTIKKRLNKKYFEVKLEVEEGETNNE